MKYLKIESLILFTVLFPHAQGVTNFGPAVAFISSG